MPTKVSFTRKAAIFLRYCFLSLLMVSIITCFSCNEEDEGGILINISDEFSVDLFQNLDKPQKEISLQISTFETFDCSNFLIETNRTEVDGNLEVSLNDIGTPEVCNEGQGFASSTIPIDISNFGQQEIKFFFNDQIFDQAFLTNFVDRVELEFTTNYGIKSYISLLTKIPTNSIIGILQFSNDDQLSQIENVISDFSNKTTALSLSDGYYGHFLVENGAVKSKDRTVNSAGFQLNVDNLDQTQLASLLEDIQEEATSLLIDGIILTQVETISN